MSDLIDRQAAIDGVKTLHDVAWKNWHEPTLSANVVLDMIRELPSAQPERLTDDDFETIRIHLNAYKEKLCNQHRWKEAEEYQRIIDRFMSFTSAQPDIIRCKECKYTDGCEPIEDGRYWCCLHESFMYYCSDAERRTDGTE